MTNTLCDGSCVYALFDWNTLVYIGQSQNVYYRIGTHIREGKKRFTHFSMFYMPQVKHEDLEAVEASLIIQYRPKYNFQYNTAADTYKVTYCQSKEDYEKRIQSDIRRFFKNKKRKQVKEKQEIRIERCETYYQQEWREKNG